MNLSKVKRVGIVGGGVAGLTTARKLLAEGFECVVFERGSQLGGVWADGYSNFGTQVQRELYEFPDWPLPDDIPDFGPGERIRQYCEDYARHFEVWPCIRFQTQVTNLRRRENGAAGWMVEFDEAGQQREMEFDFVVVCIGLYSDKPSLPEFDGRDEFQGSVLHISALKSRDQLKGKKVAVVGYGKSATDAALESAEVAAETTIIVRSPQWPVPPRLAGILPFKWAMMTRVTSTLIPPYYRPSRLELVVHSVGKPLVWLWWRIVELLLTVQCRLWSCFDRRVSLVPDVPVEIGAFGESTMLPRPDFYREVRSGQIQAQRSEIDRFTPDGVVLKNGVALDADVVILATGWQTDFSFLGSSILDSIGLEDDGMYLYRQMMHPDVPNLAFVGYASTICNILTYGLQARWLCDLLRGRVQLQGRDEMLENIKLLREWKRSWMPFSSARGARLILHLQHYHDELLQDIGAETLRKRGILAPLKEVLVPYQPRDYRTIVTGEWRRHAD